MTIKEILLSLPETIEWLVLFKIDSFSELADEQTMKDMYFLNKKTKLNLYDYVILTSQARYLSHKENNVLINGETLKEYSFSSEKNLYNAYSSFMKNYDINKADSFAVAEYPEYGKVLLHIVLKNGMAISEALFKKAPSLKFYELLQSVGVKYLGGEKDGDFFKAKYINKLHIHISSGTINDFGRTDNCNIFFFNHGNIDKVLKPGLEIASIKRLEIFKKTLFQDLKTIASHCLEEKLSMNWLPPIGEETFPFGDLVPKAYVNLALKTVGESNIQKELEKNIVSKKLRGLWTFETDDLETSTDSVLVLQSLDDKQAAMQLEQFYDGKAGYFPQLWSDKPKPGEMKYENAKKHWCQADLATTCLVFALQKKYNIETRKEVKEYILDNFESRSDLYFANPYMVDWLYAQALSKMTNVESFKMNLINEILNSLNKDFSLGSYDKVLSSAFGILALKELGYNKNVLAALQLFIMNNYYKEKNGKNIPYYSTMISDTANYKGRKVNVNETVLELSYHQDTHNMIYVSIVALAVSYSFEKFSLEENIQKYIKTVSHKRYSLDIKNYIEKYALVPYINNL